MTREKIQEWLPKAWDNDKRGLLTQRLAACLIGISDQAVKKAGDRGNIEFYECENVRLYSYTDVLLYKQTREAVILNAEQLTKDNIIKKEDPEKWENIKMERYFEEVEVERQKEEEEILLKSCLDDEEYEEHQKKIEQKNKALQNIIKSEEMKECLKNFNMTAEQLIEGMSFFRL